MNCHWKENKISFHHARKIVTLQGLSPTLTKSVEQVDLVELHQLHVDHDIWAMAVVENIPVTTSVPADTLPLSIQTILSEFDDIFSEPKGLPPHR
jgi:hypothetical protein